MDIQVGQLLELTGTSPEAFKVALKKADASHPKCGGRRNFFLKGKSLLDYCEQCEQEKLILTF